MRDKTLGTRSDKGTGLAARRQGRGYAPIQATIPASAGDKLRSEIVDALGMGRFGQPEGIPLSTSKRLFLLALAYSRSAEVRAAVDLALVTDGQG